MKQVLSLIAAGIVGLSLQGMVVAADTQQPAAQDQSAPATGGADQAGRDNEAYVAALKKCESLGADQKQKCIDAAKRKFGQM